MVRKIYEADPDLYFYPDQYNNPANWKAHFETTGPEIIRQTAGGVTHFVAAMGTSGTFMGTSRRLKRDLPSVKVYSAQPSSGFHGLEGLKHMPTAIVPGFYDDIWRTAISGSKPRTPIAWCGGWRAKRRCWWAFPPGAMSMRATLLARELVARGETATIVTMLCDSAEKYLSEHFWDEE